MEAKEWEQFADEWLERALKQRGTAEPRPGLETRILASIQAERARVLRQTWAWRPVWLSVAAVLLIAVIVLVRRTPEKISSLSVANHVGSPSVSKSPGHGAVAAVRKSPTHASRQSDSAPRLEQFPSPQPLSEQEEILARYLQQFPREAALVAQAQTQLSKQEMMEQEISEENR